MKRFFIGFIILITAFALACAQEPHVVEQPADTAAPVSVTAAPVETVPPAETDVVTVAKTEWIVTAEEGMPTIETLSGMHSLRFLDLRALPHTAYSEIEAIREALPSCRVLWNQLLTDGAFATDAETLTLPNATPEDVRMLSVFELLRSVDASGSTAYEDLCAFKASHPNVDVHYTLSLGERTISESDTSVVVPEGFDADLLIADLRWFPNITEADLRSSGWDEKAVTDFVQAFPQMKVHRMIRIGSLMLDSDAEFLDLREQSDLSTSELLAVLSAFPSLKTLALPAVMNETDAAAIRDAYQTVNIVGPVSAFGKTYEGWAEEIDISTVKLGGPEEAAELLDQLPFLKTAVMCDCGLSNDQMETLLNAYPNVKFVWTIEIGKRKLRTDAIGFSTKNPSKYTNPNSSDAYNQSVKKAIRLKEGDIEALKYCTDLEALDLGHNYLTNNDLQVIAGLTKLKILILADNKITDISALTTLKDLEYIELFMNKIPDLSPLAEMPSLIDVNVCNTGVSDLSPLMELKNAKRLWYAMNPFSKDQAAAVKAALPDCLCNYTTRDETGDGWRTDPRYHWMRSYFK